MTFPELVYRPTLRCFGHGKNRRGLPCGRRAVWMRRSEKPDGCSFFCDDCKQPGDEAIATDAAFRRVSVTVEVTLAGASLVIGAAHAEALYQIERALEALGGLVTPIGATSVVGVLRPPAPQGDELRVKGRPG